MLVQEYYTRDAIAKFYQKLIIKNVYVVSYDIYFDSYYSATVKGKAKIHFLVNYKVVEKQVHFTIKFIKCNNYWLIVKQIIKFGY